MNAVRLLLSFIRVVPARTALAVIIALACWSAEADPSTKENPSSYKSKYSGIQVTHAPAAANDKARQVPQKGTPRTKLPVLRPATPLGGKLIQTDNTYLVQCPPRLAQSSTNAAPTHGSHAK